MYSYPHIHTIQIVKVKRIEKNYKCITDSIIPFIMIALPLSIHSLLLLDWRKVIYASHPCTIPFHTSSCHLVHQDRGASDHCWQLSDHYWPPSTTAYRYWSSRLAIDHYSQFYLTTHWLLTSPCWSLLTTLFKPLLTTTCLPILIIPTDHSRTLLTSPSYHCWPLLTAAIQSMVYTVHCTYHLTTADQC